MFMFGGFLTPDGFILNTLIVSFVLKELCYTGGFVVGLLVICKVTPMVAVYSNSRNSVRYS